MDGFVLAGGLSSRMGEDKALMRLGGRTLVQIAVDKLQAVCGNARILCGATSRQALFHSFAETVPELEPGRGPLGGLVAAISASTASRVLVVPVDLPLLPWEILRQWVEIGESNPAAVSCFRADDVVQPLPVLVLRSTETVLRAELDAGRLRLRPALELAAGAHGLSITEAVALDPAGAGWFRNLNTPEDFQLAQAESGAAER